MIIELALQREAHNASALDAEAALRVSLGDALSVRLVTATEACQARLGYLVDRLLSASPAEMSIAKAVSRCQSDCKPGQNLPWGCHGVGRLAVSPHIEASFLSSEGQRPVCEES